jgi:hypothetical protein
MLFNERVIKRNPVSGTSLREFLYMMGGQKLGLGGNKREAFSMPCCYTM